MLIWPQVSILSFIVKTMNIKKIILLPILFVALTSLTGCDQVRQQVADLLNPPTPVEMSRRVDDLVRTQKYQDAITVGEQYLNKNKDPEGLVTDAVTNAYMESGDAAGAVRHMQRSGKPAQSSSASPAAETAATTTTTTTRSSGVAVDGASVTETKNGTVVRAGDAIVIMPK